MIFVLIGVFGDELKLFKLLGSILMMVMGIVTLYPGYSNINHTNLIGLGLGSTLIGLGFVFLISDALSYTKQAEWFEKEDDGRFEE